MTGMTSARARWILRVLGWRYSDLCREFNRAARTRYRSGDASKWFSGNRPIPLGVRVFLRMSVRLAAARRRLARARTEQAEQEKTAARDRDRARCVDLLARRLAAHVAAGVARGGVTYKLEVPPHDGFDKLAGAIGEWLENHVDLATIHCESGCDRGHASDSGPASA